MGEQETYQVAGLIRRLHRNSNYTIVLIEHDMRVVFNLADRITVLDQGRLLADGTPHRDRRQSRRAGGLSGDRGMNALEAEGLNTFYGKSHILHDVGAGRGRGRITDLLGRNGAGKTTTLRSLVGLTPPRSGRVTIFGQDTTRRRRSASRHSASATSRRGGAFSPT